MNRRRNRQIVIRLSDEELSIFKSKVQQSGKTQQEFLISLIKDKEIVNIDSLSIFKQIYIELKQQGNNLNQIAKALNHKKYYQYELITENQKELSNLWQSLNQYLQKLQ